MAVTAIPPLRVVTVSAVWAVCHLCHNAFAFFAFFITQRNATLLYYVALLRNPTSLITSTVTMAHIDLLSSGPYSESLWGLIITPPPPRRRGYWRYRSLIDWLTDWWCSPSFGGWLHTHSSRFWLMKCRTSLRFPLTAMLYKCKRVHHSTRIIGTLYPRIGALPF